MGRAGVTLLDVEKAALQLQGRGKNPTVDAIRELLGTGSKSTIIQHLKVWKSKSNEAQGKLPPELLALVTGLWERLNTQAELHIIEIESSGEQQIKELREMTHQSQRDHNELKIRFHQIEEILSAERHAKQAFEKQLQIEKQEHAKLRERSQINTEQMRDYKSENARLHQLAANIQANLEHYQNAIQQACSEKTLVIEKQRVQFQQELTDLQRELSIHRKQSQEYEQLILLRDAELQKLKEQYHELLQNHDNKKQELQEKTHELIIFKERCEQHEHQFQVSQKDICVKNQNLIDLEKQIAIILDQRDRLNKTLSDAEDKIQILRDEKLFLAQEKSHLKGQLKHFEAERN